MTVGELAGRTGTAKTIRYYEDIGLPPPPERVPNGYCVHQEDAVGRLPSKRDVQASRLSLTEITAVSTSPWFGQALMLQSRPGGLTRFGHSGCSRIRRVGSGRVRGRVAGG